MGFKRIYSPPRKSEGHRIAQDETGRISLFDWSGATPESTDDGPLIVERGTLIRVSTYEGGLVYEVPVTVLRGEDRTGTVHIDHETMRALWEIKGLDLRFDRSLSFRRLQDAVDWASGLPAAFC